MKGHAVGVKRVVGAVTAVAAGVVGMVVLPPVQAQAVSCPSGWNTGGPQWIGAVGASQGRGQAMALAPEGGARADGVRLVLVPYTGALSQKWCFEKNSDRTYQVKNLNSGKCIDIKGPSTANGAVVHQWPCYNGSNQVWHWVFRGQRPINGANHDTWSWHNEYSGKVLDVVGYATGNNSPTQQYDLNQPLTTNQLWY